MNYWIKLDENNVIKDVITYQYLDYIQIDVVSLPIGVTGGWWKWENNAFVLFGTPPSYLATENTDGLMTSAHFVKLGTIEVNADITDILNISTSIFNGTSKTTLVDADNLVMLDSVGGSVKKLLYSNLKINLKTYLDTLYNAYIHPIDDGNLHVPVTGTINNGKVLKAGSTAGVFNWVTLTNTDVGAAATSHAHAQSDITSLVDDLALKASIRTAPASIVISTTLALEHASKLLKIDSTSPIVITIPLNSVIGFTIGDKIRLFKYNTGAVSIEVGDVGVTIRSKDGNLIVDGQYSLVELIKIDTDEWLLTGPLVAI